MNDIQVYLEVGKKRTIAGALDWPGWCRIERDEASAMQALLVYAPRYARAIRLTGLRFEAPADASAFTVTERLQGNATTDYGTPGIQPSSDATPVAAADLPPLQRLLEAAWITLEAAAHAAQGKQLNKGPRGGGRDLEEILQHVLNAEGAYLNRLGWKDPQEAPAGPAAGTSSLAGADFFAGLAQRRKAIPKALAAAQAGELPTHGPRGGAMWPLRYFVRRSAWHVLDHAWEIEDRVL